MEPPIRPHPDGNAIVLRDCTRLAALFAVAVAGWYAWTWHPGTGLPRDGSSYVVGRDFLNFWMYGQAAAAAHPGAWYNFSAYREVIARLLGPDYPTPNWSYPPGVMLLAAPFGRLPYLAALSLWTLLGLGLLSASLLHRFGSARLTLALLVSPASVFGLISGQFSLVTTAVLVAVFRLLDRRPLVAGLLIGCLTLKPQLGFLFPVMLVVSGRWRTFAAAAITALAIAAASAALFGIDTWIAFVHDGLPVQNVILADPDRIATPFYPTLFMNLRGVGLPYGLAMMAQSALALAMTGLVVWAYRARPQSDPNDLTALFLAATVAATPYLLVYDTLPLAVFALVLLVDVDPDAKGRRLVKLVFWLPLGQMAFGMMHVPGPALVAPAFAVYLASRLRFGRTLMGVRSGLVRIDVERNALVPSGAHGV